MDHYHKDMLLNTVHRSEQEKGRANEEKYRTRLRTHKSLKEEVTNRKFWVSGDNSRLVLACPHQWDSSILWHHVARGGWAPPLPATGQVTAQTLCYLHCNVPFFLVLYYIVASLSSQAHLCSTWVTDRRLSLLPRLQALPMAVAMSSTLAYKQNLSIA